LLTKEISIRRCWHSSWTSVLVIRSKLTSQDTRFLCFRAKTDNLNRSWARLGMLIPGGRCSSPVHGRLMHDHTEVVNPLIIEQEELVKVNITLIGGDLGGGSVAKAADDINQEFLMAAVMAAAVMAGTAGATVAVAAAVVAAATAVATAVSMAAVCAAVIAALTLGHGLMVRSIRRVVFDKLRHPYCYCSQRRQCTVKRTFKTS